MFDLVIQKSIELASAQGRRLQYLSKWEKLKEPEKVDIGDP